MTLLHILVFSLLALAIGWGLPRRGRVPALLAASLVAIYWLQPSTPVRNLDFWFPTAAVSLTVLVWGLTRPAGAGSARPTLAAAALIAGVVLAIGLTRYLGPLCCLTPSRPPELLRVVLALGLGSLVAALPAGLNAGSRLRRWTLPALTILLPITLFILLKTGPLAQVTSAGLRFLSGQSAALATSLDLRWLGFSYLAFRLLHALLDFRAGRLPPYSLPEFAVYALFFPTYAAGPIDRSQRFIGELRQPAWRQEPSSQESPSQKSLSEEASHPRLDFESLVEGGRRILIGVFKKFALADTLALIALNGQNAGQVASTPWLWIMLYTYALRIYFDFSGYTDIALGLGRLLGFRLPENFDRPYLRQNLTTFWNSWHITLAQWFRAYFFNPLTRALRGWVLPSPSNAAPRRLPAWAVILAAQLGTMLLIGLWHGITWNFAAWGAWHGLGLFVHNRWSDWLRPRLAGRELPPARQRLLKFSGWLLTFHYVALGWVLFALPTPSLALQVFQKLLGFH